MLTASGDACAVALAGSGINQDGRSSSLTAPNGPSQHAVIRSALSRGNLTAANIGTLQMHGTGTSLGDPIEVGGILAALSGASRVLALGALKSCVGHAECAAGAAGLVHAATTISHFLDTGILHLRSLNPHVFNAVATRGRGKVARRAAQAHGERGGCAGVSSFAFQGTNAHAV